MKNFILAGLVVTASAIASLALADQPQTTVVKYADLDVNHAEGAAVLYKRLLNAARTVCYPLSSDRKLEMQTQARYEACITKAVNDAIAKVDRAALTEYAMSKGSPSAIKLASR
jgi:UrcA family protein